VLLVVDLFLVLDFEGIATTRVDVFNQVDHSESALSKVVEDLIVMKNILAISLNHWTFFVLGFFSEVIV
jgi:hypothetical protein